MAFETSHEYTYDSWEIVYRPTRDFGEPGFLVQDEILECAHSVINGRVYTGGIGLSWRVYVTAGHIYFDLV